MPKCKEGFRDLKPGTENRNGCPFLDFRANLEISAYDRVITLSTCAYRFENARYVLHGKLMELR